METKEIDHRRSSINPNLKKGQTDGIRRPFGVAAMDITLYMSGKLESDDEKQICVPFLHCCDKDNLDGTLRKLLNKEAVKYDKNNQGLWVSMKLLHGDIKQVREENPHLVLGNVAIARKMGFPEVILPGDVRNDLYLTLISGEFPKGNKTSDKNVEVTVTVCNEKGVVIPGVISLGGGSEPINEYRSVIYYHECNPNWYETFKVAVPIDEFKCSHLKFIFKHRSSNEAKDKSEKPFAMSYVKLMQENGTTLEDTNHNLLVYKIDYKKFDENSLDYFKLPSTAAECKDDQKVQVPGLILSKKDMFTISSNVCSTKLTQNVDLLGLLNWVSHQDTLDDSLRYLMHVNGEEVVKFLQDVLDALFNILMQNPDSSTYDSMVFNCLLYVISLISDRKYQHFQPVLDLYIKESFSATLAYNKLIVVLRDLIENMCNMSSDSNIENNVYKNKENVLYKAMKSLQYCIRFIVRSRMLFSELYDGKDQDMFESNFKQLLQSIVNLMCYTTDNTLIVQGACLKYFPNTISDILMVYDAKKLSTHLADLLVKIPKNRLTKQKMMTVNDIVHSQLFLFPECRAVLMPIITKQVRELFEVCEEVGSGRPEHRSKARSVAKVAKLLGASEYRVNQHCGYSEEVELCVKILSDILNLLFRNDVGSTVNDIKEIMLTDLRTVIQTTISMNRDNPLVGNLVAIMIAIFRQMTELHYNCYINNFSTPIDILDFLMEILLVFKDLVNKSVFASDWCEMIMLQNAVILKCLRLFSYTIRDRFSNKFDNQAWSNFFYCSIAFMTQPALQLEQFSLNKRSRILSRYRDMRLETAIEIRSMWFSLGQYKVQFVPGLVESFLEMTLIPEQELRKLTLPIFFDMMQCEFYSSKFLSESYGDTKRDSSQIKGNFADFENEMIAKLDSLIEGGKGDENYKDLFNYIMTDLCENHTSMKESGLKFVNIITRLMERLLEYRCIINDDNNGNRMSCTVNLLDFYSEINRKEMYIRYVNKLCELHLQCDNYTEAAYTLKLYSNLLNWSETPLSPLLKSNKHTHCQTHRELKEALYHHIMIFFDKGKMWECALQICHELAQQYKEEIFDYESLSGLHNRMASFYDSILKQMRPEPEYFRVAYYGKGFPALLQNKVYIHRGKEYERLSDFCSRTLNELPYAELMSKLTPPGEDITESPNQYVQINKVDPIMDHQNKRFSGKPISDQILQYYKVNDVKKFQFSRPFHKKESENKNGENEFATLWLERTVMTTTYSLPGILRWFPVNTAVTYEISPLQNAIETMEESNKTLRKLILAHHRDKTLNLNPLSLKLNGILDPAVMGGIMNYEKSFFIPEYLERHPEDDILVKKLKDMIAEQIPLLEFGIQVHKERAPGSLLPFQQRLEECFAEMQASVVEKYGKRSCDLKLETNSHSVTMRRQYSIADNRTSDISSITDASNRSRVSSLTRAQVQSFRQITASLSLIASSNSPSVHSKQSSISSMKHISLTSQVNNKLNSPSPNTKNKTKIPKDKRRSSKTDKDSILSQVIVTSGTQWYTTDTDVTSPNGTMPVFELRQELTPKRPLRSEVEKEKRLSRPPSGNFQNSRPPSSLVTVRGNGSSDNSSNRDSVGTTDSTASEEDNIPPPLPVKLREADYCNIPECEENVSFLYSGRVSLRIPNNKPLPPEPGEQLLPPTPPPKPPKP